MNDFFNSQAFIITCTFGVYYVAQLLQKKTGYVLFNPVLIAVVMIIVLLKVIGIPYETYHEHSKLIEFFLKPAVVALGVPLYQQLEKIKKQSVSIILSQLAGCVIGVVSVVLIAKALGAPKEVILSLAPKSVTTPIAMEVSGAIGGIPPLTAAIVIVVGIFGSVYGYAVMGWTRVQNPISQGLSMGTAAHAVGASRSMEISPRYAAFSSLGLIVNGILTALLTPLILKVIGQFISL